MYVYAAAERQLYHDVTQLRVSIPRATEPFAAIWKGLGLTRVTVARHVVPGGEVRINDRRGQCRVCQQHGKPLVQNSVCDACSAGCRRCAFLSLLRYGLPPAALPQLLQKPFVGGVGLRRHG